MALADAPPPYLSFDAARRRLKLDPHSPAFVQDPYEAYAWLNRQAAGFFWEDYGGWFSGRFDLVGRLLRDKRLGRQPLAPPAGNRAHLADFDRLEACSLLELEPPAHTRLRGLVNRAFVSRQVDRLKPRIAELAGTLIDGFEAQGSVDLLPAFAAPLPITIIAELLGVPAAMGETMLAWSHAMVAMYLHAPTRAVADAANQAAREFAAFIRAEAASRRRRPADDLLGAMTAAQDSAGALTEDELVASTILLLNAGHEATVHQIGNAVGTILGAGGDPRRFFANAEATAATVEECLRFDAPLHLFSRHVYRPVMLTPDLEVQPGERIGLLLGAANRDALAFAAPDRFDPHRSDAKNVSFGAGIHFCIGAPLARLELQTALKILFDRLPRLRLAAPPRYRDSYHFHGLERLEVRW